jgi:hypothetical protein
MADHSISVLLIEDNPIHARLFQDLIAATPVYRTGYGRPPGVRLGATRQGGSTWCCWIKVDAFERTLHRADQDRLDMRTAALIEGLNRVTEAKLLRGLFP